MTRSTKIALVVSGLTLLCVVGVCGAAVAARTALPSLMGCKDATAPTVSSVVDRPEHIRELFPKLGSVTAVHWQEREARPRTCPEIGPMDYILSGFAVLAPETATEYRQRYTWTAATAPEVPADLRTFAPTSPQWTSSADFDRDISGGQPVFRFDHDSGTLYFTRGTT